MLWSFEPLPQGSLLEEEAEQRRVRERMRHVIVVLLAAFAAPLSAWTPTPIAPHFRLGARVVGTTGVCSAPLRARARPVGGVRNLLAKDGDLDDVDDWAKGDITSLMSKNAPTTAAKASVAPKDTDTLLGTGQHFSPGLGEAMEKAVKDAAAGVPQSTVPALAIVFFSSEYGNSGYGVVLPVLLRAMAMHGGKVPPQQRRESANRAQIVHKILASLHSLAYSIARRVQTVWCGRRGCLTYLLLHQTGVARRRVCHRLLRPGVAPSPCHPSHAIFSSDFP